MSRVDDTDELRRTVQALAQDAELQVASFPDFVCIGDELVMEFGDALDAFRRSNPAADHRMAALSALDAHIDALSGAVDEDFWWDPARLRTDGAWERTRQLARAVLAAFGWPLDAPPRNGAIYVGAARCVKNE